MAKMFIVDLRDGGPVFRAPLCISSCSFYLWTALCSKQPITFS